MSTPAPNIPDRVREEAAAADRALQELMKPATPAANEGGAAPPPPVDGVQPQVPAAPAPDPAPAPAPAPTVTPTSDAEQLKRLQQQLQTEAGRNQAQSAELSEMKGRMAAMQEVLRAQQARATPAAAPTPRNLITEADKKDFGEDMIDFVSRMIRQEVGSSLVTLTDKLNTIEGQLRSVGQRAQSAETTAAEQAAVSYFNRLTELAPGWKTTNDDQGFLDWLKERDTFARKTRHELLADAHKEADAETVAAFFQAYWKEKGTAPAAPAAPTPTTPATPPSTLPPVDPASLVAPTPSTAPAPASNQRGGKIWTQAEIEHVYDERMKKRITPEKFAELEAEIEQAMLQGRVQ